MSFQLNSTQSLESDDEAEGAIVAEINITPLVDVFLVLLIIFMVTSSVMSQLGVQVQLPKAQSAASESQPEGVVLTLESGGTILLNQKRLPLEGPLGSDPEAMKVAREAIRQALNQSSQKLVVLEGDRQAFLGNAISIMDLAKEAGAEKFAIATSGGDASENR
jgi:biopolymer transport protein ExbD